MAIFEKGKQKSKKSSLCASLLLATIKSGQIWAFAFPDSKYFHRSVTSRMRHTRPWPGEVHGAYSHSLHWRRLRIRVKLEIVLPVNNMVAWGGANWAYSTASSEILISLGSWIGAWRPVCYDVISNTWIHLSEVTTNRPFVLLCDLCKPWAIWYITHQEIPSAIIAGCGVYN